MCPEAVRPARAVGPTSSSVSMPFNVARHGRYQDNYGSFGSRMFPAGARSHESFEQQIEGAKLDASQQYENTRGVVKGDSLGGLRPPCSESIYERFRAKSADLIEFMLLNEVHGLDVHKCDLDKITRVSEEEKECLTKLQDRLTNKHSLGALPTACLPVHNTFIHFKCTGESCYGDVESLLRETSPGRMQSCEFHVNDASRDKARQQSVQPDAGTRVTSEACDISLPGAIVTESDVHSFITRNKLDKRTAIRILARPLSVQEAIVAGGDLHGFDSRNPSSVISARIRDIEARRIGAIGSPTSAAAVRRANWSKCK